MTLAGAATDTSMSGAGGKSSSPTCTAAYPPPMRYAALFTILATTISLSTSTSSSTVRTSKVAVVWPCAMVTVRTPASPSASTSPSPRQQP